MSVSSIAAPLEAVLGKSGLVHSAIAYPVGMRSPLKLWRLVRRLRALNVSTLVYLMPPRGRMRSVRDRIFFRSCGVKRIVGLPSRTGRRHQRLQRDFEEPEYQRLARSLSSLGPIDLANPSAWDLLLTDDELAVGREVVRRFQGTPFIAINMGGKTVEQDWGTDNWRSLLTMLARSHPSYGLLAVGAAEDSIRVHSVTRKWPGQMVDVCGRLSPRESAAALKYAIAFIGHDSGPLHLAASNSVTCIGLFGSHNPPKLWHPYGESHHIIHRMEGISAISVDDVMSEVNAVLPPSTALYADGERIGDH